jgi:hypothetical protein
MGRRSDTGMTWQSEKGSTRAPMAAVLMLVPVAALAVWLFVDAPAVVPGSVAAVDPRPPKPSVPLMFDMARSSTEPRMAPGPRQAAAPRRAPPPRGELREASAALSR